MERKTVVRWRVDYKDWHSGWREFDTYSEEDRARKEANFPNRRLVRIEETFIEGESQ